jgi:hypothetical protein
MGRPALGSATAFVFVVIVFLSIAPATLGQRFSLFAVGRAVDGFANGARDLLAQLGRVALSPFDALSGERDALPVDLD